MKNTKEKRRNMDKEREKKLCKIKCKRKVITRLLYKSHKVWVNLSRHLLRVDVERGIQG